MAKAKRQLHGGLGAHVAPSGQVEFQEFVSIDLKAGYASIFGKGNEVRIDLCPHCLKSTLGPWLRISDAAPGRDRLQEQLRQFDPERHGGEFPASEDG